MFMVVLVDNSPIECFVGLLKGEISSTVVCCNPFVPCVLGGTSPIGFVGCFVVLVVLAGGSGEISPVEKSHLGFFDFPEIMFEIVLRSRLVFFARYDIDPVITSPVSVLVMEMGLEFKVRKVW